MEIYITVTIYLLRRNFAYQVYTQKSADPVGSKSWRQYITKKLRFSFSKPRLEHLLISLRELNDDFRTLSAQTSTLHSPELQKKSDYVRTSRWEVEKYKVIGRASKQVYEALGNACTKHTEHQAHFCVEVEQAIIQGESGAQVKFNMAYTHLQLAGNLHDDSELMWFVVDSTSGNIIKEGTAANITTCKQSFASTLKRQLGSTSCDTHKKIKKSVRFHTEPAPTASLVPNIPCAVVEDATIPDDCLRKDFCDLLRRRFRDQPQATECLGVLQAGAQCKNFVYPSSQKKCRRSGQAVTLGQMISKMGKGQYGDGIPLYDRLRLAKTLAVAVLQYHSTPWLKLSWRSEDVYFFEDGTASTHESPSLPSPHLNVRMGGACSQLSRASGFPCHSLARNPLLFSLGVVLLEIAYTSSLHNLQKPLDMESSREPQYTEFFAARRLAKSARTDMGIRYHKVVEKLIECDFGCSSDLNDPHLQAAFHTEVICPLERLEQKLHEFHFD